MGLEDDVAAALARRDLDAAGEVAVRGYGPEILGFLGSFLRSEDDAREAFSQACLDLWSGLPSFRGESSVRTWFYTLARHAALRLRRAADRRPGRRERLSRAQEIADAVRTETLPYLRTAAKDRLATIRDALDDEARSLLVLRVDRKLSWAEIATILADEEPTAAARPRLEARLRKRFQGVKEDLKERFREAGLLQGDER